MSPLSPLSPSAISNQLSAPERSLTADLVVSSVERMLTGDRFVFNNRTTLRGIAPSLRVGDSYGSETGAEPDQPNHRTPFFTPLSPLSLFSLPSQIAHPAIQYPPGQEQPGE